MDINEKKELKRVIESLVIAIGREESTAEFYEYLAKTIKHPETREFLQNIAQKESGDIEQTEAFLEEIENDLKRLG